MPEPGELSGSQEPEIDGKYVLGTMGLFMESLEALPFDDPTRSRFEPACTLAFNAICYPTDPTLPRSLANTTFRTPDEAIEVLAEEYEGAQQRVVYLTAQPLDEYPPGQRLAIASDIVTAKNYTRYASDAAGVIHEIVVMTRIVQTLDPEDKTALDAVMEEVIRNASKVGLSYSDVIAVAGFEHDVLPEDKEWLATQEDAAMVRCVDAMWDAKQRGVRVSASPEIFAKTMGETYIQLGPDDEGYDRVMRLRHRVDRDDFLRSQPGGEGGVDRLHAAGLAHMEMTIAADAVANAIRGMR